MPRIRFVLLLLMMVGALPAVAQVADSVDVQDYDLAFDFSSTDGTFSGRADVRLVLTRPCSEFALMLSYAPDSVFVDGEQVEPRFVSSTVFIPAPEGADTLTATLFYHGTGYVEGGGWGGLHINDDMIYNLGVAFAASPHSVGRMLFPCRENFTDKATYTLRLKCREGWTAQCGGVRTSRSFDSEGCEHTVWRIAQPTPPYLVSLSCADWHRIEGSVQGVDSTYPLTLGFTTQDSLGVLAAFAELDSVVPMFERCFGPYRWGRIGYIATEQGSMESVNNIALDRTFMDVVSERGQSTIAHELGHAWFGNTITCTTEGDMWINEGGASFCSEVAMEATSGRAAATAYYQKNLADVVRTTHITDNGYLALHDMPSQRTYGSTTYDKGALVWHSLRGVLGDSVFYAAMRRLMSEVAFGNIDADGLRDSLSAYTGRDLADFFDFHVKEAGFVSYHVVASQQGQQLKVRMLPQPVGTQALPASHRLPITFFGYEGQKQTLWFDFDSSAMEADRFVAEASLDFDMRFYVLDYECALSDAATLADLYMAEPATIVLPNLFMNFRTNADADSGHYVIEHRWGRPLGLDTVEGVRRVARRYWVVNGTMPDNNTARASFRLVKSTNTTSDYAYIDQGFYNRNVELDSMRLMYRPSEAESWRVVNASRMGTPEQAIFVCNGVAPGEYAFATVDTALLDIPTPDALMLDGLGLYPNPLPAGMPLQVDLPDDMGGFSLAVFDHLGRLVRQQEGCRGGQPIDLNLPSGIYLVRIENKYVTLQSNLIQL